MKNFEQFINEQLAQPTGMLYLEQGADEEYAQDWTTTIDISDIWQQHEENQLDDVAFNQKYAIKLEQVSNQLDKEAWSEISEYVQKLKIEKEPEKYHVVYENLYDIFDKYQILLKYN